MVKKYLIGISICALFMGQGFAQDSDASGQQALKQLQLLQQRLMQQNANDKNDGAQLSKELKTSEAKISQSKTPVPAQPKPEPKPRVNQTRQDASPKLSREPSSQSEKDEINELAFEKATSQMFPLKYQQYMDIHKKYNQKQFAISATPGTPPKPIAGSQFVKLAPGSTPPVIRLGRGFVSSVVFLDSNGNPWPIVGYDLGDPAAFNIQWDRQGNILMIQAMKLYSYGNMAVKLEGLNTPVMLTLVPGQKVIDYRTDMRVQGFGPNSEDRPVATGIPAAADNVLLNVLQGIAPQSSKRLMVKGGPASAWKLGEKIYVRTNLTVVSPGWIASMTSADGMKAYEMQAAPVLLVSWHGKLMQLKLEGL